MDVQTISITLAGIGVFIAAINSIYSSREARQQRRVEIDTRQAELLSVMYNRWSSTEMRTLLTKMQRRWSWENADDFETKYGGPDSDFEAWTAIISLGTFFEGIGVLVDRGLVDFFLVDSLIRNSLMSYWEKCGPLWLELRERSKARYASGRYKLKPNPHLDSLERLYNKMLMQDQRQATASA